jgi:hypothetical protein
MSSSRSLCLFSLLLFHGGAKNSGEDSSEEEFVPYLDQEVDWGPALSSVRGRSCWVWQV